MTARSATAPRSSAPATSAASWSYDRRSASRRVRDHGQPVRRPSDGDGRRHLRDQRPGERRVPCAPAARHRAHSHAHLGGRRVPLCMAGQAVGPYDPYLFGKLAAKNVSATLRVSYTFTPRLTLQAYAQAFFASGHFSDIRAVGNLPTGAGAPPRQPGETVHLSTLGELCRCRPGALTPTSRRRPSTPA